MPKITLCTEKGCPFEGRYCRAHSSSFKPASTIDAKSEKMTAALREYSKKRKLFLAAHPKCEAMIDRDGCSCQKKATEVHHMKGRIGDLLLDENYWLATCNNCHRWIELNPMPAKAMGLSLSRLSISEK